MEKEEKIKKEVKRLEKIFKNIKVEKKDTVKKLIQNAAFIGCTLEELQDSINKNGTVSEYQNGANQWGTKKSPEIEIYNTMIKNYSSIIKQLTDLLPKGEEIKPEDDGFDDFLNSK